MNHILKGLTDRPTYLLYNLQTGEHLSSDAIKFIIRRRKEPNFFDNINLLYRHGEEL